MGLRRSPGTSSKIHENGALEKNKYINVQHQCGRTENFCRIKSGSVARHNGGVHHFPHCDNYEKRFHN